MSESATPQNAGATKPEGSLEVGAHTSSSLSSSLVLSSSSLRTLVEAARQATHQLRDAAREGRVIEFRQRDPLVMAIHKALDAADDLAALLSPVAVDETHEDTLTRTGDDGLSTSSRTASTDTKG